MEDPKMMRRKTRFGSLEHYEKGGVEVINDDPRNYAFSNIFEVASKSEPYEKVAVAKNLKYVLETIRAANHAFRRSVKVNSDTQGGKNGTSASSQQRRPGSPGRRIASSARP